MVTVEELTEMMIEDFDLGYRYCAEPVGKGQVLPHSHVWDGDQRTDEELPGVCCFETMEQAKRYAQWSDGQIVMVAGVSHGGGELAGEVIIEPSGIVATWARSNRRDEWTRIS